MEPEIVRARSVAVELALLVAIVAVPLAGLGAFLLYDSARREQEHASGVVRQLAVVTAERASNYVETMREALEALARRPRVRAMDPNDCDPGLADLLQFYPRSGNILTVDLEGRFVCGAIPPPRDRVLRISDETLLKEMLADPRFRVSKPLIGRISKRWGVTAVQPVFAEGAHLVGLVSMSIDLLTWIPFTTLIGLQRDVAIAVLTSDGVVIARSTEPEKWIGRSTSSGEIHRLAVSIKDGTLKARGVAGLERVWGFTPVSGTDWYALAGLPADQVFETARLRTIGSIMLLLAVLAAALAVALALMAKLARPLRAIAAAVRARAEGNAELRVPVAGPREVAALAGELNRMIDTGERMQQELRASETKFRSIFDNTVEAIFQTSREGRLAICNPAAARILGYDSPEDLIDSITDLATQVYVDPEDRRKVLREIEANGFVRGYEVRYRRKDGSIIWASLSARIMRDEGGDFIGMLGLAHDITERRSQLQRIERLTRVYAVLSGINAAIVRIRDRDELFREACRIAVDAGKFRLAWLGIVDGNATHLKLVAWHGAGEGYVGLMPLRIDVAPGQRGLAAHALMERKTMISDDMTRDPRILLSEQALARGFHSLVILPLLIADEAVGVLALYAGEVGFFDGEEMKLLQELAGDIAFAIGHIREMEKLDYLAYYDSLTGLANRTLFIEHLSQNLHTAGQAGDKLALVLADVERLRNINDSLGRQTGDALLKALAGRLARGANRTELARISADQFAVVLQDVKGRSAVTRRFERMWQDCFGVPFVLDGAELRIAGKAGIALFPNDGIDAETLVRNAEAALRRAKQTGERHVFHAAEMTEHTAEKLTLENRLRQALEKDEFVLHYQPKVDLEARRIVGVEALIRWQSPELGLVPPGQFIPLMEETGMILEAGAWALSRAVLDHKRWLDLGLQAPRVAVNVSAVQLRKKDYLATLSEALQRGATPTGIDLEITESLVMDDIQGNIEKLAQARKLGVSIAIDDFGTGYSSLGYLARLPVQALKIDRSFIITMLAEPDTMTLVSTIISLAHSLKLKVVAEGVDSEDQAKILRLLRCDEMQGYLYSRPVPFDDITALLRKG